MQLSALKIGDNVSLPYSLFASTPWVSSEVGQGMGGSGAGSSFALQGTITGVVIGLNLPGGLVAINPGEYINFSYVNIAGAGWLTRMEIASGQQIGGGVTEPSGQYSGQGGSGQGGSGQGLSGQGGSGQAGSEKAGKCQQQGMMSPNPTSLNQKGQGSQLSVCPPGSNL
jgi:hypothetical protein